MWRHKKIGLSLNSDDNSNDDYSNRYKMLSVNQDIS